MSDEQLKAIATAQYETQASSETKVHDFPTEIVELPSKGKFYPEGHPLSKGTIEMKYMTAKEEDILTNQSYIKSGKVLDKLFKALIITPCNYNDLLLGDKNAIMIAARVLGYGKDYTVHIQSPSGQKIDKIIDLTKLEEKQIDWEQFDKGDPFLFELPISKRKVRIRHMTQGLEARVEQEQKGLKRLKKPDATLTTRYKQFITEIDGETDNSTIRKFVDNELLAVDSRALRKHLVSITPDINLKLEEIDPETGDPFSFNFTIGLDFFWPDAEI
jgi:hypothetical protein